MQITHRTDMRPHINSSFLPRLANVKRQIRYCLHVGLGDTYAARTPQDAEKARSKTADNTYRSPTQFKPNRLVFWVVDTGLLRVRDPREQQYLACQERNIRNESCPLTLFDSIPKHPPLRALQPRPSPHIHLRRDVPFLNIRFPKFGAFTTGGDGLIPGAFAGDAEVAGEEEGEDECELGGEEDEGRVCVLREWGLISSRDGTKHEEGARGTNMS